MNSGSNLGNKIMEIRKMGKSYNQISQTLNISKGTISYYLANNRASKKIRNQLIKKNNALSKKRVQKLVSQNRKRWAKNKINAVMEAKNDFKELYKNPLFTTGISIYWGEGDSKPDNPLRISNTDPRMIKIYVRFLREIMGVERDKIRLGLILYPDLDNKICQEFWSKASNLPKENFIKTQYIKGSHPTKRLASGICMVIANGGNPLKIKMLTWIDLLSRNL
jgi:predicted transcriptional regulator